MPTLRIVGPGRAGLSLAAAVDGTSFDLVDVLGRDAELETAAQGVDLVVIATPDSVIHQVAEAIAPSPTTVIAHLAGSLGLDVLGRHQRRAAIHPLVALPDAETGAQRLRAGAWFAIAGDAMARDLVTVLDGRPFEIDDEDRTLYHAAAVIASNHLVALLGQAERVSELAGVPFEAMLDLVRATIDNVVQFGPAAALTGPASRGDESTIARHLEALPPEEVAAYESMADEARRLAGRPSKGESPRGTGQ